MSRFRSYRAPDTSVIDVEALAVGFGIGAVLGVVFPFMAFVAEVGMGASVSGLLTRPSAPLVITMLTPAGTGLAMAVAYHMASTWKKAYRSVAGKASALMEENWELVAVETPIPVVVATEPGGVATSPGEVTVDELVNAQNDVLCSVGVATQDVARRMHINLRGLSMTDLDTAQGRMVDALAGHVEGLWDLADDVVGYSEESENRAPTPIAAPRNRDVRSAKPARPPGRVAV